MHAQNVLQRTVRTRSGDVESGNSVGASFVFGDTCRADVSEGLSDAISCRCGVFHRTHRAAQ